MHGLGVRIISFCGAWVREHSMRACAYASVLGSGGVREHICQLVVCDVHKQRRQPRDVARECLPDSDSTQLRQASSAHGMQRTTQRKRWYRCAIPPKGTNSHTSEMRGAQRTRERDSSAGGRQSSPNSDRLLE